MSVSAFTASCAAGVGRHALLSALRERRGGLRYNDFTREPLPTWIGRVPGLEARPVPEPLSDWDCRNNRLAWLGLEQDDFCQRVREARERYGASRVAVIMGTSTSSIQATEDAYRRLTPDGQYPPDLRRPTIHKLHSLGEFVGRALELTGLCLTVSTACSSSAKVFGHAERVLRLGLADAAVVGGTDSLCDSILFGFHSLELISPEPCRPFDRVRRGLSLGEASGYALLEREGSGPFLLGYGESSDAYHMSAPQPEGAGARRAICTALEVARVSAGEIDYINLHGTATQKNDEIEGRVVSALFPRHARASSTKGWTGHALGAAGIVEAVVTLIALETGLVPGTLNSESLDPACGEHVQLENSESELRHALSHSFGFGGSNSVLLFGAARH